MDGHRRWRSFFQFHHVVVLRIVFVVHKVKNKLKLIKFRLHSLECVQHTPTVDERTAMFDLVPFEVCQKSFPRAHTCTAEVEIVKFTKLRPTLQ